MSRPNEAKRFVAELNRICELQGNSMFSRQDLYQIACDLGIRLDNFDDFIDTLNSQVCDHYKCTLQYITAYDMCVIDVRMLMYAILISYINDAINTSSYYMWNESYECCN